MVTSTASCGKLLHRFRTHNYEEELESRARLLGYVLLPISSRVRDCDYHQQAGNCPVERLRYLIPSRTVHSSVHGTFVPRGSHCIPSVPGRQRAL